MPCAESTENREKKRRRRSRWGSDAPQPSPAAGPASRPTMPGPAAVPGQPPMGFTPGPPGGMSGYPPPGFPPAGLRPPGMAMNPQLGAAAMPKPNMPGAGSKYTPVCSYIIYCCFIIDHVLWRWWLGGRKGIRPVKTEWWGAGMVVCLERGADLHMTQLMPLSLTVSCFSNIQIGFTFLVPAHPGSPGQRAVKRLCVCVRACVRAAGKVLELVVSILLSVRLFPLNQWPLTLIFCMYESWQ